MCKFSDRDLGIDCNFEVSGGPMQEVRRLAMAHAKEAQGDVHMSLRPGQTAETDKNLMAAIKPA